jgi:hypothetical protein
LPSSLRSTLPFPRFAVPLFFEEQAKHNIT